MGTRGKPQRLELGDCVLFYQGMPEAQLPAQSSVSGKKESRFLSLVY